MRTIVLVFLFKHSIVTMTCCSCGCCSCSYALACVCISVGVAVTDMMIWDFSNEKTASSLVQLIVTLFISITFQLWLDCELVLWTECVWCEHLKRTFFHFHSFFIDFLLKKKDIIMINDTNFDLIINILMFVLMIHLFIQKN